MNVAPEVVRGNGHTKAVDWWSVGILLYELCVGIPPFYSRNVNEMYDKIQHGVLKFPPFLSEACRNVIVQVRVRRCCGTCDLPSLDVRFVFTRVLLVARGHYVHASWCTVPYMVCASCF